MRPLAEIIFQLLQNLVYVVNTRFIEMLVELLANEMGGCIMSHNQREGADQSDRRSATFRTNPNAWTRPAG